MPGKLPPVLIRMETGKWLGYLVEPSTAIAYNTIVPLNERKEALMPLP
jgi:hypothetical protein